MLTKVEVDDLQGHTLSLPLADTSSGYTLKSIDGLDPVKATIVSSSFAQLDGSQQQSARRENRNIIITIGMEPYSGVASVKSLRTALYNYFMPKAFLNLKFYDDNILIATIRGQVESCEAPLFTKEPQMVISILCFDPSFLAPNTTRVNGMSVNNSDEQTVAYPGTIETGYVLTLNVNRTMASGFSVFNRRPDGTPNQMDVTADLANLDVVTISTVSRDKYVKKNGNSILYSVTPTSKWAPLYPGNNFIRVFATGYSVPFTIDYQAKYGGL